MKSIASAFLLFCFLSFPLFLFGSDIDVQEIIRMKNFELNQNEKFFSDMEVSREKYFNDIIEEFMNKEMGGNLTNPFYYIKSINEHFFKTKEQREILWELKLNVYFSPTVYQRYLIDLTNKYSETIKSQRNTLLIDNDLTGLYDTSINLSKLPIFSFQSNPELGKKLLVQSEKQALTDFLVDTVPDLLPFLILLIAIIGIGSFVFVPNIFTPIIAIIAILCALIFGTISTSKTEKVLKSYYSNYYLAFDLEFKRELVTNINNFYDNMLEDKTNND